MKAWAETRRTRHGVVLGPRQPDSRTYDDRQAPNCLVMCAGCGRVFHATLRRETQITRAPWRCSACDCDTPDTT